MFENFNESIEKVLDRITAYMWELFEQDMKTAEVIMEHVEHFSSSLKRFFQATR